MRMPHIPVDREEIARRFQPYSTVHPWAYRALAGGISELESISSSLWGVLSFPDDAGHEHQTFKSHMCQLRAALSHIRLDQGKIGYGTWPSEA